MHECVCVQPHFAQTICLYLVGEREKGRIFFEQTLYDVIKAMEVDSSGPLHLVINAKQVVTNRIFN